MSGRIDAKEEVDRSTTGCLLEGLVEALVAGIRRAPNFVLEGLVNVLFRIRLDDEIASL